MHSYHEDERLRARPFRGRPASRSRNVPFLFAAIITASLTLHAGGARSADRLADSPAATAPGSDTGTKLETVTIQAARARKELRRRVSRFVFSVVVSHMNDSLPRWNEPICPLIAGLPRAQGEYILARISQVATAAHAPLAGEHCKPNLFVIATPYPQTLLEKWWARDTRMYNICSGVGGVETFIHSKSPIRVWYNTMPGIKLPIQLDAPSLGLKLGPTSRCISAGEGGTRLAQAVLELSQTFIVIDTDLGQSGASAADREGFQRLVTEVSLGRAGIVLGLEVSRLARNSMDRHRLLEICALADTLILDEDGVYDPAHFNDRLLLGLKGTE